MKPKKKMSMYMGGGKNKPMYVLGGKVYDDGGSLMEALMKDPKQRAAAKKMLGSMEKGGMMYGEKGMKVKKYQEGGMNATGETRKGASPEDQAMAIVKQKGAERQAALQPFRNLESEVNAARKTYDEHLDRLKVLSKHGSAYKRMLQTLRKDREAIANLLKDDRMNIEGVSDVERSNMRRMMPK